MDIKLQLSEALEAALAAHLKAQAEASRVLVDRVGGLLETFGQFMKVAERQMMGPAGREARMREENAEMDKELNKLREARNDHKREADKLHESKRAAEQARAERDRDRDRRDHGRRV